MSGDLFKIPNLISLGRVLFLIPIWYCLALPNENARYWALAVIGVAVVSDFLDGYLARKLNQKTELGLILDPLSDKILAAGVVFLLIGYRDFPIWLAGTIILRDLLILSGGLLIKKKTGIIPPSILTGKYCFASVGILLMSYVLKFDYGIRMFFYISMFFMVASFILYIREMVRILRSGQVVRFQDKPLFKTARITSIVIIAIFYFGRLLGMY